MKEDLKNKISIAEQQFQEWRSLSFDQRQSYLPRFAEVLERYKDEFSRLITTEMNKPISESVSEIGKCIKMVRYYSEIDNYNAAEKVETEFKISEIRYEPLGIILGVMPWNFPFWQALRFIIPAILAGNVAVMKHASICFGSGKAIESAMEEAGFPSGVFQNLKIGHKEVEELLAHPAVRAVSLTGSEKAGAQVASTAAIHIKKSVLELGGSDAFIVMQDADLRRAAEEGARARLQNCGQACNAGKRFIVQENIAEDFLPMLVEEFKKFQPGDKFKAETLLSGLAKAEFGDDLEAQYRRALEAGAEILLPLNRVSDIAFEPGLLKVLPGNPVLKEEVFGPLGFILFAENAAEALEIANDVPYGLSASVWTHDEKLSNYFTENLECGMVSINKMSSSDPRLPFGGIKNSGFGTELSHLALREFVHAKTIVGH